MTTILPQPKVRRLLFLPPLALGLGLVVWYWICDNKPALQFQTVPVSCGELTQVVTGTGQVNPEETVQVGCQLSGRIQKLCADYNSPVRKGDVLAEIDPASYEALVHQAEGELASAKAVLELSRLEAKRLEQLFLKELVPKSELDKSRADLHQAEATVQVKEAGLEKAKVDLAHCSIYAPMDGIVISRNVDVGQTVAASLSAPTLFLIAKDLTKMQIDCNIPEADIGNVEVNQSATFTVDAFPQRQFRGQVVQVRNAPTILQNVVTYDCVVEVTNPDLKLKPGMTANVSIVIAHCENILKIPNIALRVSMPDTIQKKNTGAPTEPGKTQGKGKANRKPHTVYVVPASNIKVSPRPVQIKKGITDGTETEVTEGLAEGDRVVVGISGLQARASDPSSPFGGGVRKY